MKRLRWIMIAIVLLVPAIFLLLGRKQPPRTIRVLAAASLRDAFTGIAQSYQARHPGTRIELAFAGSQTLRLQIEQGAPADVFASADRVHMDPLLRAGLIDAEHVFARNRLVVIVPANDSKVHTLSDLARRDVRVVLAGSDVPAGRYARMAITRLDASGRFGPGYMARVRANVVSREQDVRAVLAKVALDEADAGIVYATDARAESRRVRVIPIPSAANVTAEYPIAVVRRSPSPVAAKRFVDFVLGPEGQAILRRDGFLP